MIFLSVTRSTDFGAKASNTGRLDWNMRKEQREFALEEDWAPLMQG